ncbi:MAG: HU family DNA-binding protein [Bacteroidales bacterium]|nr:HU family DNA-binding protein [Bacteroidales bacterium]
MSINYIKKKRTVYSHGARKEAYVARIQYTGHIDENIIAEDISSATTASDSEVGMYIRELEKIIGKYLAEGYVVNLNNLGSFSPAFDATTVDDPNEVTHRTVKRKKIIFTPSANLQKMMDEASLHLADTRVAKAIVRSSKKQK